MAAAAATTAAPQSPDAKSPNIYPSSTGGPPLLMRQTSVELACSLYGERAKDLIVTVQQKEKERAQGKGGPALKDCIFVGHNNTDLDSVGSAIGAAELFGGTSQCLCAYGMTVLLVCSRRV
jgi:hypothetical protein